MCTPGKGSYYLRSKFAVGTPHAENIIQVAVCSHSFTYNLYIVCVVYIDSDDCKNVENVMQTPSINQLIINLILMFNPGIVAFGESILIYSPCRIRSGG